MFRVGSLLFVERPIIGGIIRKPKVKNHILYEHDLNHIDCEKNKITFYRHINCSDDSRPKSIMSSR